ncbi:CRISPR-associated endonuclease Cas1 [Leptospira sp. GIMC2001]|uniref:CRISPR-associated endonuclease Cas1 n=1 Tax=Leptospira sp. GIMC2001 TaxID=1513297 RepID=UPI00234B17AF|nr:CRISPR-associated endonuclease Cas1 [Leptospira sp. GIMC2001]WCL49093.1 CRISPR-associated endonuclease Cas1 [Leptospira sp. GIMC2001]
MRHLTVINAGSHLKLDGGLLLIMEGSDLIKEVPLNRVKSVTVLNRGVSLTSNLVQSFSDRGIRLFIQDFRKRHTACISGTHQHAVVAIRKKQFEMIESKSETIASSIIYGKLRNQRAVLSYFSKYFQTEKTEKYEELKNTSEELLVLSNRLIESSNSNEPDWRNRILGYEGRGAAIYWKTISNTDLGGNSFKSRTGRGAIEITNQALNLGYAILESYVWNALSNTGMEIYAGFLHTDRPGKPSLVVDFMEEYRPWVVDRSVMKLRAELNKKKQLDDSLKKSLIQEIHKTFLKKYHYKKQKLKLESILQKQAYRLAGSFFDKEYKPYIFKW